MTFHDHEHPTCSTPKETKFFTRFYPQNVTLNTVKLSFLRLFPRSSACQHFFDATPQSIWWPEVELRMKALIPITLQPHIRFLVVLREPISRYLSQLNHIYRGTFTVNMSFSEWVNPMILHHNECLRSHRDFLEAFTCDTTYRPPHHGLLNWQAGLATGFYAAHLSRWTRLWSRNQILVLPFETLVHNWSRATHAILNHFGLPILNFSLPKVNSKGKRIAVLTCDTRNRLLRAYTPWNLLLYQQLQEDRATGQTPKVELIFTPFVNPSCVQEESFTTRLSAQFTHQYPQIAVLSAAVAAIILHLRVSRRNLAVF